MENWNEQNTRDLIELYKNYNIPSDRIIRDRTKLDYFTMLYNQTTKGFKQDVDNMACALLNFRKAGFLPRLRRLKKDE